MTLADLVPGEMGIVENVAASGPLEQRLLDLGLTPGTSVEARFANSSGNPMAYAFRGVVIALRLDSAALVTIRLDEGS